MANGNGKWPLPEGWVWSTLGSVCTKPQYGYTAKAVDSGDGPRFVRITDLSKGQVDWDSVPYSSPPPSNPEKYHLQTDDILVARAGSVGVAYRVTDPPPSVFASYLIRFRSLGPLPKYIEYFLQSPGYWRQIEDNTMGITIPNVNATKLSEIDLPLPPLPTQHRIVAEIEKQFTRLDAAVAALKRAKANLARYKAAVLKAAVEGRLVPQDPNDEPAAALLARILTERRAQWEAANPKKQYVEPKRPDVDGLPELPVGWVWATVEEITSRIQYGHTASAVYEPVGPKFLRITDIQDGFVDWDAVPWCHCTQEEFGKYRLSSGDIVFARTGATTGKSYLIRDCPKTVFASYLIRLQLTKPFDERYLVYYFDSPFYWSRITSEQKGSAQPGVNATILSTLQVPVPPLTEQARIVNEVERCLSVIHANDQLIDADLARAERLRQGVLGKAFRGELVPLLE